MNAQTPPPLPAAMGLEPPKPFVVEKPLPLVAERQSCPVYPVEALGPLRPVVVAVQGETQAPVAIVAASTLAIAAFAMQGFADIETLGNSTSPLSLYFLTVAKSGERKSTVESKLTKALDAYFKEQQHTFNKDMRNWKNKTALWKQTWDAARKADDCGQALDALEPEPTKPRYPNRLVNDPTVEGLFRMFDEGQPSLALLSDEGGLFTGGHSMKPENRQRSFAVLNSLWGGQALHKTRGGDGHTSLLGRRLSLHLMVQPGVSKAILGDAQATDIGFVGRCLVCFPESTIGKRSSSNATIDQAPIEAFNEQLLEALNQAMPFDPQSGELELPTLGLSPEAKSQLTAFSDEVEIAQLEGGDYAHITGEASKIAEQAARIAGVLTLWANRAATSVSEAGMRDAISIARFYLSEAARLASEARVSSELALAERLRLWLKDKWDRPEVVLRDVMHDGPNSLRNKKKALAALELLEDHFWLSKLPNQSFVNGAQRVNAWRLHPDLM